MKPEYVKKALFTTKFGDKLIDIESHDLQIWQTTVDFVNQ